MELKQTQCFLSKLVCCFGLILLHQTQRNQYKWGKNISKTGNILNYILHVCGKNINKKQHTSFVKEHWVCFKSCFMLNHSKYMRSDFTVWCEITSQTLS